MKRKKLTLDRTTLGVLSNAEKKNIVGGSAEASSTMTGANGQCANTVKITYASTSLLAGCPVTLSPKPTCDSVGPKVSCTA